MVGATMRSWLLFVFEDGK